MTQSRKIMIIAGESSGDTHAAKLVRAMREMDTDAAIQFFGAAGPKMRQEGVEAIVESDGLSIVGLAEIAAALPIFLSAFRDLKAAAISQRPEVVILVDFPDFNLKLARALKRKGFHVVYYISPQLWAWRKYRISSVKKNIDLMLTILPFEKDWYAKHGIENVEYVGSPLAREVHSDVGKEEFCRKHGLAPDRPIISLLPGSRQKEIVRILPVMLEAAAKISKQNSNVQFLVALASERNRSDVEKAVDGAVSDGLELSGVKKIEGETYDALNASDAAAVTSGTATLEAGIIGTPMAIVYKTSALNYKLFEPLIDVPHYGLINLIAEKRVAKELIQDEFTPKSLSDELLRLLEPNANSEMRSELKIAADKLGHGGASKRAAEAIFNLLDRGSS
ncbi:MAG: lipid-A-disaccharide synthase [Chloracidobacterium sp.]|nr:lipid-A-disaccharide synthase [Chloracidobacterium sp.]